MNLTKLEFIKTRKIWYTISIVLIVIGILSLCFRGLNWGIDFTGGSILEYKFNQETKVTIADMNKILGQFGLSEESSIIESNDAAFNGLLIRTIEVPQEKVSEITEAVKAKFADAELLKNEQVGPTIGKDLKTKALLALIIASAAVLIYITARFKFDFGIAAIAALLHDVLMMIAVFSLFQLEINTQFVAALLTILGFSINDTIVTFDRIRENMKIHRKMPLGELCNRSIIETLPRSINTSATVLMTVTAMLIFGGSSIRLFMLALLVGMISGVYSSICIASPLIVSMAKGKDKKNTVSA